MSRFRGIHHHVLVRRRGGAAGVARALAQAQAAERPVSFSYEVDDSGLAGGEPEVRFACAPQDLARAAPEASLVHVHATRSWLDLLQGFRDAARPVVVTAHDCRLLTGGCVYPLDCAALALGCPDPCPRRYAQSAAVYAATRALVEAARPVLAAPSAWLGRQLRRAWPGLGVKVIPNGVDGGDAGERRAARAAMGFSPEARVAVFLAHGGTQAAYKGGGRFLALWRAVKAGEPLAVGVIAGGGQTRRDGDLLELPYLEGAALRRVLCAGDALVYPSLADNHPLVVLEAMASGLPVAAYAVGGIPEQIVSGEHGLLCPPGDEAALADNALALLRDRSLARNLALRARERQAACFSTARMAAAYARLYDAVSSV